MLKKLCFDMHTIEIPGRHGAPLGRPIVSSSTPSGPHNLKLGEAAHTNSISTSQTAFKQRLGWIPSTSYSSTGALQPPVLSTHPHNFFLLAHLIRTRRVGKFLSCNLPWCLQGAERSTLSALVSIRHQITNLSGGSCGESLQSSGLST